MRTIRRRLMRSYANLDIPIEWKDEAVATWAKDKGLTTRRDVAGYTGTIAGWGGNNLPGGTVRHFPELRWFDSVSTVTFYMWKNLEDVRLPETLTKLPASCCRGDVSLRYIDLPMGLESLGEACFYDGCAKLELRRLPPGLKYIGGYCFEGCTKITVSRIPDGVSQCLIRTFGQCDGIETMTFPAGVTSIADTYLRSGNLRWVKMLGALPPSKVGDHVFYGVRAVYVPDDSVDAYKKALSEYRSVIHPMSEWTE